MPTVTAQDRPQAIADEGNFRAPKKLVNASTRTDLDAPSASPGARQASDSVVTEPVKEVTLSPQLAALARKEAKFRQQEQAFKAEQAKLETERAEISKLKDLKTKLDAKDYSILDSLGVSYEEWTNYLISKGEAEKPELQAVKALEEKVKTLEESQKSQVSKQYEATIEQYKRDIKSTIEANAEYSSIKEKKAEGYVLQHILDTFNEEGEILTVDQAAKDIEEAIIEEAKEWQSLSKLKAAIEPEKKQLPAPRSGLRTLTNEVTQVIPSTPRNQFQFLTMKERIAASIAKSQK